MSPMPTARPRTTSADTFGSCHTRQNPRLAPAGSGALLRLPGAQKFRVSKDGTRIHYASAHSKRNVLMYPDAGDAGTRLPDLFVRVLLSRFATQPAWATAHRCWRVQPQGANRWTIALELRGTPVGRVQFPSPSGLGLVQPAGVLVDTDDEAGFRAAAEHLWTLADLFEQDVHAPADLSFLTAGTYPS